MITYNNRALNFDEKKYALLPRIKVNSVNKEKLSNLSIQYLRENKLLPETILNEAALLGWSVVNKEKELENMKKNKKDYIFLNIANVINEFDLKLVDDEHAVFIQSRLFFLNNKSLVRRYLQTDMKYRRANSMTIH